MQSCNDFLVFGSVAIGSFLSDSLLTRQEWGKALGSSYAARVAGRRADAWTPGRKVATEFAQEII